MKLFQLIICFTCSAAITVAGTTLINSNYKLKKQSMEIRSSLSRDKFICQGFISMCQRLNEVDEKNCDGWYVKSVEWKKLCLSMFNLEELSLEITSDGYCQRWSADGKMLAVNCKK